ncbi:MAG TPA: hypothetical protein PLF88_02485 [Opitutaceae bacterium]|nr:hypothetical protein [Opitutaceae bacterium]HRJ46027.1 hypothetical protein [Opitutaceae bacterium]
MNAKKVILLSWLLLSFAAVALAQRSDLATPEKRNASVALATKLLQPRELSAMPETLIPPFNPPAFEQPDPEEIRAQQAAALAAQAANITIRPTGDRGVLETLAERLAPSGTVIIGGEAVLLFGQKRLKVGDRLTIAFEGVEYNLDITAIGRTTFTLRLNREEITRPIKSGK